MFFCRGVLAATDRAHRAAPPDIQASGSRPSRCSTRCGGRVDCRDVIARLSEYLDQELAEEWTRDIEAHFAGCPDCRVYALTVRKTIALYRREADCECPEQVRIRLHAILAYEYRKK